LSLEEAAFIRERIRTLPERIQEWWKWNREGGPELDMARQGNIEPLREFVRKALGADIAEHVQLIKPKRGVKFVPYPDEHKQRIASAVADVRRTQNLFRQHYDGKTDQALAIEVAAARHGVEEDKVAESLKRAPASAVGAPPSPK
jgi:hypothetical protein